MSTLAAPLLLFLVVAADDPPAPKLTDPKDARAVLGPRDREGNLDYEAILNDRLGKGIAPDRNANVLLWKAMGPTPEGGAGMPPEFFKRLGMKEPPKGGDYFIGLYPYMRDHLRIDPKDFNAHFEEQSRAGQRPWVAKDYPVLASWLKKNDKHLALVIEATKRPDYYNPLVSRRPDKGPGSLISVLLPGVQRCRELARPLTARAMLRVGEGKFDDAWQDLLACHRLGRLVARGATLIEALVGIAIDAIASNAELAYLDRAGLTSKQIQARLKDLQALPPLPPMADKIDLGERLMYHDSLQLIRRSGANTLDSVIGGGPAKKPTAEELKAMDRLDWNLMLRNGDRWYDRMAAAMRHKDRAAREKLLDQLEKDLVALKKGTDPGGLARLLKKKKAPDKAVSKSISDILITLLMPAVRKVQTAYDRAEQVQRNLHVAFALAAYRRDSGRYPARLADLAPRYLREVPGDLFSGRALVYRLEGKGFLVYSVGANGRDEGGRWFDDDPPGDDPRVRLPLPPLKPMR